jgi:hypothetical protein
VVPDANSNGSNYSNMAIFTDSGGSREHTIIDGWLEDSQSIGMSIKEIFKQKVEQQEPILDKTKNIYQPKKSIKKKLQKRIK